MECCLRKTTLASVVGIILICGATPLKGEVIRHVNRDQCLGAQNGTGWVDAYCHLQDALTEARSTGAIDEIWVAADTGQVIYSPDDGIGYTTGNKTHTFQLVNDVEIYGGFAGDEDWRALCIGGSNNGNECHHASDCPDDDHSIGSC